MSTSFFHDLIPEAEAVIIFLRLVSYIAGRGGFGGVSMGSPQIFLFFFVGNCFFGGPGNFFFSGGGTPPGEFKKCIFRCNFDHPLGEDAAGVQKKIKHRAFFSKKLGKFGTPKNDAFLQDFAVFAHFTNKTIQDFILNFFKGIFDDFEHL